MRHFFILIILNSIFFFVLEARNPSKIRIGECPTDRALITVAKSGTNLCNKLIQKITGKKRIYCPTTREFLNLKNNSICETHFQHKHVVDFIKKKPSLNKIVINIRDPRDVLVSAAFFYSHLYFFNDRSQSCRSFLNKEFSILSIYDRLKLLLSPPRKLISTPVYDIKAACSFLANDFNKERFFLIKYEDLIPKDKKAENICSELSSFLGYNHTNEFIRDTLNSSIGKSPTFRTGQTSNWKVYFDDELKNLFKAILGDELIFLGYESDYNW